MKKLCQVLVLKVVDLARHWEGLRWGHGGWGGWLPLSLKENKPAKVKCQVKFWGTLRTGVSFLSIKCYTQPLFIF